MPSLYMLRFLLPPMLFVLTTGVFADVTTVPVSLAKEASSHIPSTDMLEQRIERTRVKLLQLHQDIANTQRLKTELQRRFTDIDADVDDHAQQLADFNTKVTAFDARLVVIEQQLHSTQAIAGKHKSSLAASLRWLREIHNQPTGLKIILQHHDPAAATRQTIYQSYLMEAHQQRVQQLTQQLQQLAAARTIHRQDRHWLQQLEEQSRQLHADAHRQRQQTDSRLSVMEGDLITQHQLLAALQTDQKQLNRLLADMRSAELDSSGYFLAGRGHYRLPVHGRLSNQFGDSKGLGGLRWTGLFIQAALGQTVAAIADGEVAYSDWLPGFGMLVVVDHGGGYLTLYGGNSEVSVATGDWVDSGATLALSGEGIVRDSRGQSMPGVYFEIRHHATPLDPEAWVGTNNRLETAKQQASLAENP